VSIELKILRITNPMRYRYYQKAQRKSLITMVNGNLLKSILYTGRELSNYCQLQGTIKNLYVYSNTEVEIEGRTLQA